MTRARPRAPGLEVGPLEPVADSYHCGMSASTTSTSGHPARVGLEHRHGLDKKCHFAGENAPNEPRAILGVVVASRGSDAGEPRQCPYMDIRYGRRPRGPSRDSLAAGDVQIADIPHRGGCPNNGTRGEHPFVPNIGTARGRRRLCSELSVRKFFLERPSAGGGEGRAGGSSELSVRKFFRPLAPVA